MRRRLVFLALPLLGLLPLTAGAAPAPAPRLAGCPLFPASNVWNERVDSLPVAANSQVIVDAIGADTGLHADFGSGLYEGRPIGIPYTVVSGKTPGVRVRFQYADESDPGPYPIPENVRIEGGRARTATATR